METREKWLKTFNRYKKSRLILMNLTDTLNSAEGNEELGIEACAFCHEKNTLRLDCFSTKTCNCPWARTFGNCLSVRGKNDHRDLIAHLLESVTAIHKIVLTIQKKYPDDVDFIDKDVCDYKEKYEEE